MYICIACTLPNCNPPVVGVGVVPNRGVWVVGVANPVGLLKFNVGWELNKFDEVVGAAEANWNPPVAGCVVWFVLKPNVGWACVEGVPKVMLPVPNAGGAVVLRNNV